MLRLLTEGRVRRDDGGFTVVEMVVVLALSSIVLIAAFSGLTSLANAAVRNDATVTREQAVSTAMGWLERDIRSASSISFPSGASPADELQLAVASTGSGTSTNVLWLYDVSAGTLTRETQVNGSYQPSGTALSGVSNGSTPIFTYSGLQGRDISSHSSSDIARCSTGVGLDVKITSTQATGGTFEETSQVALTSQALSLNPPGNGLCGS